MNTSVILDVPGETKIEVLSNIVKTAEQKGLITSNEKILAKLLKTIENKSDIALNGLAFPSVYFNGQMLPSSAFILSRTKNPIDFNSQDGKPVQLIALTLIKNSSTIELLKAMLSVTRLLKNVDFLKTFRYTKDSNEILLLLNEALTWKH